MVLDAPDLALGFVIAIGVGALVGLERERTALSDGRASFGGIRTFPLLALLGSLAGILQGVVGVAGFAAPFLAATLLLALAFAREPRSEERPRLGLTTEIAALLVFCIGAIPFLEVPGLAFQDRLVLAGALGAVVMTALSLKEPLHTLAARTSREDLFATVRFVLLAAVALPLLPDRSWDPYGALNPFRIGVFVVLIAGVSFFGYVAVRILGARRGIGLTAAFGGLVSSTAVTLTFSGRARQQPALTRTCALAIVLASTIMFPRMLFLVGVIRADLLGLAAPALGTMLLVGIAGSLILWRRSGRGDASRAAEGGSEPQLSNPFSLKQALKLGVLFALIRLVAAAAYQQFGAGGLYASATLSGVVDVDPITISVSRMVAAGQVGGGEAVLALALAALTNTLVKSGLALVLGGRRVGLLVASVLVPATVAGIAAVLIAG